MRDAPLRSCIDARRSARILVLVAPLVALSLPDVAAAQAEPAPAEALLGRARTLLEETEFEAARAVLEDVRDDIGFTRQDVIEWLVLRLRIASALRDAAGVERELARLAALTESPTLPPVLRARFEALRTSVSPLRIDLEREGADLVAYVNIEDPTLVRARRVHVEEPAGARSADDRISSERPDRCRAEAIGPGGAVLASATGCPAPAAAAEVPTTPVAASGDGVDGGWLAVGIGAALALVAGAVVLGVVLSDGGSASVPVESVVVRW